MSNPINEVKTVLAHLNGVNPNTGEHNLRLVYNEETYNVAVRAFFGDQQINPNIWIPFHVNLQGYTVLVYGKIAELAERLNRKPTLLINKRDNLETYIEQTIKKQLRQKLVLFIQRSKGVFVDTPERELLLLDDEQIKKVFTNVLKWQENNDVIQAISLHAKSLRARISLRYPLLDLAKYFDSIQAVSFALAYKTFYDSPYDNKSLAFILGFNRKTFNKIEILFLKCIDWNAYFQVPFLGSR